MKPENICVSIGDVSVTLARQLGMMHPLVEFRLDLLNVTPEQIEQLGLSATRWVATCREGKYNARERQVQLSAAIHAKATWVDIEYEADDAWRQPIIDLAKKKGTRVIISYHNFENTPTRTELDEIIDKSRKMGADEVKIAVMAVTPADAARVMSLYDGNTDLIAFAMGEYGKITRIAAPLLGSPFTFAAFDDAHATAPGQITVNEMLQLPF